MNRFKNEKIILSIMITAVIIMLTAVATYAFFAANITGTDASASVYFATANQGITITFEGGEAETLTNIYPRESAWLEKDITIKSTAIASDITSIYTFNIVVEENDFHANDIKYTFINKEATGVEPGYTETGDLTNLESKIDIAHGYVKGTNASEITYTLRVYFVNENDRNQNTGSAQTARFYITYNWGNTVNLTVNLAGGQGISNMSVTANSSITLPEPTKPGYIFTGWEVTGATIEGNQLTMGTTDATITATFREATDFELDTWETIASHVQNGTAQSRYKVGDTREIELTGFTNSEENSNGKYTLRILNNSNYNCTLESKTACGLVIGFDDIIEEGSTLADYTTDTGGWEKTIVRNRLVNNIFNALPADLQENIATTQAISGHGDGSSNKSRADGNWVTQDKLYALNDVEVWGDCRSNDNIYHCSTVSGKNLTRQMDYFKNLNVTRTENIDIVAKNYNNRIATWWLRDASEGYEEVFYWVGYDGDPGSGGAGYFGGTLPAFRIKAA